ncbi:M48 family metallopeptidase [Rhodobacteraceae bacterium HSP-20]|uniref:M48 family metallopeptidase n=1 Tax=Paragemmobacter amnigenus TaxID=2852097 RepID=A0ABS6J9I6_9RHOB|nr:SprT family zinc-dependent metalloprotease [Rhodobacter amnigenus]MBU9699554.1 M48 family metallopeptidase [Rhodobacter amnigenus]MBV4390781.1 M48 family metallopeptidase [Rhodobacter amnigenus]
MPVLPGSPPVEIVLKRSARARRFSLRVSRLDGRVTLSLPARAREAEAMDFARAQEGWLRETLAAMPSRAGVGIGSEVPVEGRLLRLVAATGRGVRVEGDSLLVPGDPAQAGARVGAFLKALARERLVAASDRHAAAIGRTVTRVTLRDTRSRWGSCAHDGSLMYSWRLVMAPPSVLDYVAAHEVAHMVEMNHSDRFWAVVERLYPRWQVQRKWLHAEGQALHAYRFGD